MRDLQFLWFVVTVIYVSYRVLDYLRRITNALEKREAKTDDGGSGA